MKLTLAALAAVLGILAGPTAVQDARTARTGHADGAPAAHLVHNTIRFDDTAVDVTLVDLL